MLIFFLVYFSIYGGMNLYFFLKVYLAFRLTGFRLLLFGTFVLLMVLGPILVRMLERASQHFPARVLAYVSFIWMAAALWFLFLSAAVDAYNLLLRAASLATPSATGYLLPARPVIGGIMLVIVLLSTWGLVENSKIRVERVTVKTSTISPGEKPVRIAQISDLHLGLIVGKSKLARVIRLIEKEKPDIFVSTGDLLDGLAPHLDDTSAMFAGIKAPLGKYAVMGNHEFYVGINESVAFHERAGFRVLRGESVKAGDSIVIAGVDDPSGSRVGSPSWTDEAAALSGADEGVFTLLLKHQPIVLPSSREKFDLQLSGHTHGGQIFPFNFLVKRRYQYMKGNYNLPSGSLIHTSRGTGTWGPPFRVLSPPEITLITLIPK